jgi:tRNA/tmRNA/rRNA uracil-C5-methylase (TrmA/RlmC/RlmD family)
MQPPETINVLDKHGGFTILAPTLQYVKRFATIDEKSFQGWERKMVETNTLWRPASVLNGRSPIGKLISFNEESFFQNNNDVTQALYQVKGYRYKIVVWFDNKTKERIAYA